MPLPEVSAEAFAHAVERLALHRDRPVVVKLGGSAMEDPAATDACLRSVAVLHRLGVPLVLVHGGGKPIDRAMADAGLVPKKVAGRRYTDAATLDIVVRVLFEINEDLARRLSDFGASAYGMSDVDPFPLTGTVLRLVDANGKAIDLGRVGTITSVDKEWLAAWQLAGGKDVPIIPSLAVDDAREGKCLNINADTAASAVAGSIGAEKAIFLSDIPGVLRDRKNPASLIPKLTETECRSLIAEGVIEGGMVPKVEACFEALAAGAKSAFILDGREPFSLLRVFLHDSFPGTEITQ
ncbi:MAG: acetylglutamate kinase [Gemmataceae bacterium]